MTQLALPLKWHGGKGGCRDLRNWIIGLMPSHVHYVEPYFGGGSVLLAKPFDGISEVVNDLDGRLVGFFRVLQDDRLFQRFARVAGAVPFAEREWIDAGGRLDDPDPVLRAVAFFVRCRQSLAGRMDTFTPLPRRRTRRGMNDAVSAWLSAIDGLPAVHARLMRVAILHRPALEVIRTQDGPDTLFYCDPPYVPATRTAPKVYGAFEMTATDHEELLDTIRQAKGKAMISGYPSPLYDRLLPGWTRHVFAVKNSAAGGKKKRDMLEAVWCNFTPTRKNESRGGLTQRPIL